MSVRRHMARLATVGAILGGLLAVAASPALAEGDRVEVRAADRFTVGESPGTVAIEVRKRTDGCVLLRTGLGLRLNGLEPSNVQVQANVGGRWWPVGVSGGGGVVSTPHTAPANPTLCKGNSITVRYRVAFLAGAPGGRLEVAGEAVTARGRLLGRGADSSRVVGAARAATPSPTPTKKPSPTPSAMATGLPIAGDTASAVAVALDPAAAQRAAEEASGGSPIMFFGIALVLVGAALIVLLVRRNRADKADDHAAGHPEVPLPRTVGGTTYRSAAPTGQAYGQQPPTPGGYGGTPPPRPTGNVYGGSPAPGRPGDEPPAPAGGDATTVMPRLPG